MTRNRPFVVPKRTFHSNLSFRYRRDSAGRRICGCGLFSESWPDVLCCGVSFSARSIKFEEESKDRVSVPFSSLDLRYFPGCLVNLWLRRPNTNICLLIKMSFRWIMFLYSTKLKPIKYFAGHMLMSRQ